MAEDTLANADKSNKELTQASEHNEKFGLYWAIMFFTMGMLLLFFDFVK